MIAEYTIGRKLLNLTKEISMMPSSAPTLSYLFSYANNPWSTVPEQETKVPIAEQKSTTESWVEKQLAFNKEPIQVPEETITLYQKFVALHPRLIKTSLSKKADPIPLEVVEEPVMTTFSVAGTSRISRLNPQARHQGVAISSISTLFTNLLEERAILLADAENAEFSRCTASHEMDQIVAILEKYNNRRQALQIDLEEKIAIETRTTHLLQMLDDRIASIGEHTIQAERNIRILKGDSIGDDVKCNSCLAVFHSSEAIECLDFDTPFGHLVSGSNKAITVFDLSAKKTCGILEGHGGLVNSVQIAGYLVVSGAQDGLVKVWDISRVQPSNIPMVDADDLLEPLVRTLYGHTAEITSVQFEDSKVISGSCDKTLRQWDLETGKTISVLFPHIQKDVSNVSHHSRSNSTLSFFSDEFQGFSEIPTNVNTTNTTIRSNGNRVGCLYFLKHALAAGYGDGLIRLFDLRTSKCHRTLKEHTSAVTSLTFTDHEMISGSADGTVKLWDLRMGGVKGTLTLESKVTSITVDYSRIVVASSEDISIYSRFTGDLAHTLKGHSDVVQTVKIGGERLISGGLDGQTRIWAL